MGPPGFLDISLPACHGLKTPTGLHVLAIHRTLSYCLRYSLKPRHPQLATDFEAVPALKGARTPLRPTGCSVYASPALFAPFNGAPPQVQHSIRAGGYPLPDGDLHPARYAELCPALNESVEKALLKVFPFPGRADF